MFQKIRAFFIWILEVTSVIHFVSLFVGGNFISIPIFLYLFTTRFYYLPFLYLLWMYFDDLTPFRGGRRFEWARQLFIWKYLARYFPITLHKTVDLDPTKNYMFCFHPHGIITASCVAIFATEAVDFSKKFPGITIHPLTLNILFRCPLYREYAMALGVGSVGKDSVNFKLTKLGEGHSVCIVTGGAAEATLSDPENPYRLKLKHRSGFIREALIAGAPLVPVFSFGETHIFEQYKVKPGSWLDLFQSFTHNVIGCIALTFHGPLPFFPYRHPIDCVVGAPIILPRIESPTEEDIEVWHGKYIEAMQKLFNAHKEKYGVPGKDLELY